MAQRRKKTAKERKERAHRNKLASPALFEKKLDRVLKEAVRHREKGNYSPALSVLEKHEEEFGHTARYADEMALLLLTRHELDKAEAAYKRAIRLFGESKSRYSHLGFVHHQRGEYQEAVKYQRLALELDPNCAAIYINLANSLENLGMFEEAKTALEVAYALDKSNTEILFTLATLMLSFGQIKEGAILYDAGFGCGRRHPPVDVKKDYWRGEDISGKTILVWRENGLGDEIRNANLYHDLIARAGHVIIECQERLKPIFERTFPTATVIVQTFDKYKNINTRRPAFDYHIGANSLLQYFREKPEDFPDRHGHLTANPEKVAFWNKRFSELPGKAVVGLSWSTQLKLESRIQHIFDLDALRDILVTPDVSFVNLYYGKCDADIQAVKDKYGVTIHRWDDIDMMNDLDGVLAYTKACDLAITAATSNNDIAGAAGIPSWTFLPPHDVDMLGTKGMPHLPSVRVYPKKKDGRWEPAMKKVKEDFDAWLAARGAQSQPEQALEMA